MIKIANKIKVDHFEFKWIETFEFITFYDCKLFTQLIHIQDQIKNG